MARLITVTDDEIGTTARIEIDQTEDGHIVRRIEVSADSDSGVPERLVSALIPFIGLPAVRPPKSGQKVETSRPSPAVPAFSEAPIEMTEKARELLARVPEQRAPEEVDDEEETPAPATKTPTPADIAPRVSGNPGAGYAYRPGDTTYVAGLKKPSNEEFDEAIAKLGSDPGTLADHFGVPKGNIYSWLQTYRRHKRAASNS